MSENFAKARKRRRRAIDPSIGYYIYSQCTSELKETENGRMANSFQESVSTPISDGAIVCSGLPCPPKTSAEQPENSMPVEKKLLRRDNSNGQKFSGMPLLGGLALSSRCVDQSTVNHLELRSRKVVRNRSLELESSGCSDSDAAPFKHQGRNPRQWRRQKQGFKQRIYQAAIASGVDPINVLVQPKNTPLSKAPLCFRPVSPPQPRRSRGSILAHNKKDNPFQDSRFSHALGPSKPKVPLSRWHSTFPNLSTTHRRETGTKGANARGDTQDVLTSHPLHFVPLFQAEEQYTAMFVRAQQ